MLGIGCDVPGKHIKVMAKPCEHEHLVQEGGTKHFTVGVASQRPSVSR